MKKIVISYDGGKESTLALYKMIEEGYEPMELLVMLEEGKESTWYYRVHEDLISKASFSLNVNICLVECSKEDYDELFEEQLMYLKEQGAEACVFGYINEEEHKKWCIDRCNAAGVEAIFPLWGMDREDLNNDFINAGFNSLIKKVNLEYLGEEYLGKELTKELIDEFREKGINPYGENGEYNTFVYDGPIFNFPVPFEKKGISKEENYAYYNIE